MDVATRQHLLLGSELYRAGDFEAALSYLEKVVAAGDSFADVHNMLGVAYCQTGRAAEARRHFEKALGVNPAYTEAAVNLAICYNDAGRYGDSREVLRLAMRGRGSAMARLDEAARSRVANLHAELGEAYLAVGLLPRAAHEFMVAATTCPDFPDFGLKLAVVLRDMGRLDEAISRLGALRDRHPGYLPGRVQLGVALWQAGQNERARREWDEVLACEPEHPMARFYLAALDKAPRPRAATRNR